MMMGSLVIVVALMIPPTLPLVIIAGAVIAVRSGALA